MSLFANVAEQAKIYPGEIFFNNTSFYRGVTQLNIFVVGCGGTGSYLVPNLARLLSVKQSENLHTCLYLIDRDEVEEKNLLRQNFIQSDIGKNKAVALATRYSRAFGIPIAAVEDYWPVHSNSDTHSWLIDILRNTVNIFNNPQINDEVNLIISCVDNVKTRIAIDEYRKEFIRHTPIWIDTGNEEFRGQVVYTDYYNLFDHGDTPTVFDIFPNMRDQMSVSDHPDALSCADHALSAPQNIGANMTSAQCAFNYFNIVYHNICVIKNMSATGRSLLDAAQDLFTIQHNVCFFNIEKGYLSSEAHFNDNFVNLYKKYGLASKIQKARDMFAEENATARETVFNITNNSDSIEPESVVSEPVAVEEPRLDIFREEVVR
jgi:molybdopterin/thiamine biosynthesis adenylyltransferase